MKYVITGFIVGALLTMSLFWVGGFNFDERSLDSAAVYFATLSFGSLGAILAGALKDINDL